MNKKAFTLIELLIVIIILGVMAALITGNFFTSLKKGRDAKRKADLEQIQRALEMYYEDKKAYPITELVFGNALTDSDSGKVYMQKVPNDPTSGKDYEYVSANGTDYKIFACLENNLQRLPYESSGHSLTCDGCEDKDGAPVAECIWGVSSSNISP